MGSLLDTDVISQRVKAAPDARVLRWLSRIEEAEMFLSVISLLEIRKGVESMPHGRKRQNLDTWLKIDLRRSFPGRILSVDDQIAEEAGLILSSRKQAGAEPQIADALIAATAKVHGLKVATLNRKHFERLGVELVEF